MVYEFERIENYKIKKDERNISLSIYDVRKAAKILLDKYFKRIGFWNVDIDAFYDLRFIPKYDDEKVVVKYSKELLKTDAKKHGSEIKQKRTIDGLFYMKTGNIYRIAGKLVKFIGTINDLVVEIMKRYDTYLDYPEFNPEEWMKYLADHPTGIEQIKGRVVKLSYKPVDCWYGDGMRGEDDDNIRCSVDENSVIKYNFYDKDVDHKAEEKLIKDLIEKSGLFEEIEEDEIVVDLNKFERYLNKNFDKFVQQEIAAIKHREDSKYNRVIKGLEEIQKIAVLTTAKPYAWDEIANEISMYTFDYSVYEMHTKYHEIFEKFARYILEKELVEKYNKVAENLVIYKIVAGNDRYKTYYYLQIPSKLLDSERVNKILIKPKIQSVGKFIGKGGENIKQISAELGKKLIVLKD